jgi:hypothetical protein
MEVFSDNTIKMGTFNQEAIIVSGSRTGMGTATPQAKLHISGANNDSLFRIQSPASASIMFVSDSGNIGIGTLTPTQKISVDNGNVGFTSGFGISWDSDTEWIKRAAASDQLQLATQNTVRLNIGSTQGQLVTIGLGATTGTAQFQVRGGGATAASTAMRIEDSGGNARLTILDDGTSAFNTSHLYISSSGRIGVGTATPTMGLLDINGIARARSILYFGGTGAGDWQGAISGQASGLLINANLVTINNSGYASPATQSFVINTSQNVAIGPHSPTARLHISGASNSGLLEIDSPALNNIIYVSGSGNVGIGTGTPSTTLQVAGTSSLQNIIFDAHNTYDIGTSAVRARNIWGAGIVVGSTSYFTSAVIYNNARIGGEHTATALLHISGSDSAQMMRINSPSNANILFVSGNGNVGIGTGTPTNTLQVVGGITATSFTGSLLGTASLAQNALTASFITPTGTNAFVQDGNSFGATAVLGTNDNNSLGLETNGSTRLFISSSGNVGIGTSNTSYTLQVAGPIYQSAAQLLIAASGSVAAEVPFIASNGVGDRKLQMGIYDNGVVPVGIDMFEINNDYPSTYLNFRINNADLVRMTGSFVGIGTTSPTNTLNVNGTTFLQGGQTTVRGSGATSATTALRVENSSATARLTILDDGTFAFNTNHLYISSSGDVGIGTSTPEDKLNLVNGTLRIQTSAEKSIIRGTSFHSGLYLGNNIFYSGSADPVTNSYYFLDSGSNNRNGNLLLIRANSSTTSLGGFYFYTGATGSVANSLAPLTENFRILPSSSHFSNTRVGIGAAANASYAFDVASSAPNAGAARINGNNTVWLFNDVAQVSRGTTSINRMVQMNMGPVIASSGVQSLLVLSQSINQSSTAGYTTLVVNANQTGTGSGNKLLQAWQFNGVNQTVINNSGSLGIGTETPNGVIDVVQGGNSRILVTTDSGFVGLQQSSPAEYIHITSDPASTKYLQIDAAQASNPPPRYLPGVPAKEIYGQTADDFALGTPDYWMEIILNGNTVLIPCYSPA